MKDIKNDWCEVSFRDKRWSLKVPGELDIVDASIAIRFHNGDTSTADEWKLLAEKKGKCKDPCGQGSFISVTFEEPQRRLKITWTISVYDREPVAAFSIGIENTGNKEHYLKHLSPVYAVSGMSSLVRIGCGTAEELVVAGDELWMSEDTHLKKLDGRRFTDSWWVSILGERKTSKGIVVGIGERANTQTRISFNRRDSFFEMEVAGEMDVNRKGRPFRLKPGGSFHMNRCILVTGENIFRAAERYSVCLGNYMRLKLHFPPYTGIFCAYGQDRKARANFIEFPLTRGRVVELMTVLENHISDYGIDYIKTQFGGLSSGPGNMVFHRRDWTQKPVFPDVETSLSEYIRAEGFTPDTFNLRKHHPGGVEALSREVHRRGFKHALVSRPFLNVEGGTKERDKLAASIFKMAVEKWGYDYLMFDFVSCDYENDEDDTVTMAEGIRNRFQAVRRAVGGDIFIEACMMMWGPVVGVADGLRPTGDWRAGREKEMADEFSSLYFLHGRIFQLDLEFFHPALKGFTWGSFKRDVFSSLERIKSWASFSALSGSSYLTGGVIEDVSEERWHIFTRAMPIYGKCAAPVDILRTRSPRVWKLDAEVSGYPYTVLGLFNWQGTDFEEIEVSFEKCGLSPDKRYILFDFWKECVVGIYSGSYCAELSPGSCQILFVHEVPLKPIVVGTDRHVTGAIGLREFKVLRGKISGVSEGPPGREVSHYVYVPGGAGPSKTFNCQCDMSQFSVLRVKVKLDGERSKKRKTVSRKWYVNLDAAGITI